MPDDDPASVPTLVDLLPLGDAPYTASGTGGALHRLTPKQLLYFYTPSEWEVFIREWATTLGPYDSLKILAGPGDRGIDVAGLASPAGLAGPWDCFQCKHYEKPLMPSDAFPEIAKLFLHVDAGHYASPTTYTFLAPRGCGPTLNAMLSNAADLERSFLNYVDKAVEQEKLSHVAAAAIRRQAAAADFQMFSAEQIEDVLKAHQNTEYFIDRFDQPLPLRPDIVVPPAFVPSKESRYAAKLIDVYIELEPDCGVTEETVSAHPKYGKHMKRQREAFFNAEALREFARDKVLPGTFDRLLEDLYVGVVDVAESPHANGMQRLRSVLTQASNVDLTAHRLVTVTRTPDRHGMCHQLASADRLDWVDR